MRLGDQLHFISTSIRAKPLQSFLTGLGIAVGIAAVILLTSMGEGLQRFVVAEFTQFGANLIGINPGKVTTMGTPLGILGSERLLTLEDSEALRRLPQAEAVVPMVQGNVEVSAEGRTRRITLYGVGPEMDRAFRMQVGASRRQILMLFLMEGTFLAGLGGAAGLAAGFGCASLIHALVPLLPVHTPWSFVFFAELLSMVIGIVAGIIPARQAARLDPVEALRSE